ncbi:D-hexose-6-phosphate mutarotase [Marinobacter fonticola]|uniref:D-hexose-6-phosphate mutarotase n=1 Tax=Marinobacter fonticola TaxID=2603215 RepID=UPI0011E73693|nr:D-hexose-6-phosphate mutarotase [Marinobacter fonticola]
MTSHTSCALFTSLTVANGQEAVEIQHPQFFARIYLQGAHLTHFAPAESDNWLWLSPTARYEAGVAIRGGIPVCWPWFGDPARNPPAVAERIARQTAHGFARTLPWTLERTESSSQHVEVTLSLEPNTLDHAFGDWPVRADITFRFTADSCRISLTTRSLSQQPVAFTEALHTYFPTKDVAETTVRGFDATRYTDTLRQWQTFDQSGAIRFDGETDRIYHAGGPIHIDSPQGTTRLETQGSDSTVVWNPGPEKAARLSDFPDTAWKSMLCVETANATPHCIRLMEGQSHTTSLLLSKG